MTDKLQNSATAALGGTKEKIGHATGNEQLAASGAQQKAQAHAQQEVHDAQRHTEGAGNKIKGQAQKGLN
ncbi:hypothetical protein DFQ26_004704 [Actinomortierella ambigua]|nr:hypothetical protein DFQ26_004704 [Actinomortierella ambigua]